MIHCLHDRFTGMVQTRVARKSSRDNGQGFSTYDLLDYCRINVSHTVKKSCIGTGDTIAKLVGMKHEGIAGNAVAQRAP